MGYGVDGAGFESTIGTNVFFFLQNFRTSLGAHPASCSMSTGFFRLGKVAGTWSWLLHFVLRLNMSGAVPLCPLCAFMVWIGKQILLKLHICRPYVCSISRVLRCYMVLDHSEIMRELLQFMEGEYVLMVRWSGQIVNRWFFIRRRREGKAGFDRVLLTLKVNFGGGGPVI